MGHPRTAPRARTVVDKQRLQMALARCASLRAIFRAGSWPSIHIASAAYSKRRMRRHRRTKPLARPTSHKPSSCSMPITSQPVCFTTGTSRARPQSRPEELLGLAADILGTKSGQTSCWPMRNTSRSSCWTRSRRRRISTSWSPCPISPASAGKLRELPPRRSSRDGRVTPTAKLAYTPKNSQAGPFYQYAQREGERPEEYHYKAFLSTKDGDEVEELTGDFPKRWHVEEFFNGSQALGWNRAGTCNLNIRYGQMTMALIASSRDRSAS